MVSGAHFSMNFLLLCIQSTVCVACVDLAKKIGVISFRDFDMKDAKAWFPISSLLVSVIYTGSKSLVSSTCIFHSWIFCLTHAHGATSKYTSVYNIQESDNNSYCTRFISPHLFGIVIVYRHMESLFGLAEE